MSGSSLDGLDIAYCQFSTINEQVEWKLLQAETIAYPQRWITRLGKLPYQNALIFAKTNTYFGHFMGELVNDFIRRHNVEPDFIASHGHTIFHFPDKRMTTQIGDGGALAAITGFPVINDFRTQDIAIDGEGTPLAPAADRYLFPKHDFYMNIGGISNITCNVNGRYIAFDISPANQALNFLAEQLDLEYDKDGEVARSGKMDAELLAALNDFDYFEKSYPKSLGNDWIREQFIPTFIRFDSSWEDKLHTATHQIASQTAKAMQAICEKEGLNKPKYDLFITGGGALNKYLIECIQAATVQVGINTTIKLPSKSIIDFKEAILMGLLGILRVENRPNCFKSVTGARRDTIGGAVHQGWRKFL